ncbi:hypothetical protein LCGC14_1752210 [marine sediment metagenome]|uniref:Uncharacterized protein n=1 Tax=marine sediment metagenome TaxID=412755 RepID=A0A0F9H3N9_9ZZZZ
MQLDPAPRFDNVYFNAVARMNEGEYMATTPTTQEIYEANGELPEVYVAEVGEVGGMDCANCGVTPEWMAVWYAVVDEREGGAVAYFGHQDQAEDFAKTVRLTLEKRPYAARA